MSDADTLRMLTAANVHLAAQAGADALDDNPRLRATIAGLETALEAAKANARPDVPDTYQVQAGDTLLKIGRAFLVQVHDIKAWNRLDPDSDTIHPGQVLHLTGPAPEPAPAPRFPGDPGPGRIHLGASIAGNGSPAAHEQATGRPLPIRRRFYRADQWQPTGALVAACREDHTAGRIPWVSFKTPWADTAAGKLDAQLDALFTALAALGGPVWLIVNHEPENDGGNPADYRAQQQRIRARLDASPARNVSLGGCLMTWTWDDRSGRTPADWLPQPGTWDWLGADHYTDTGAAWDRPAWRRFLAAADRMGVPGAVPEFGFRRDDPQGADKMRTFHAAMLAAGVVAASYFDSNLNSTGTGWTLDGPGLVEFHRLLTA